MFTYIISSTVLLNLLSLGESRGIIFNNEYARGIDGNSSHLRMKYFSFTKYNRTAKVGNIEFDLFVPVDSKNDVDVLFAFSVFKSNEYKRTPITFPAKLCNILGTKKFDIPNITSNSTLQKCPLSQGHNYMYNIYLTSNGWPKALPAGRYLLDVRFFYQKDLLLMIEWMLEIIQV